MDRLVKAKEDAHLKFIRMFGEGIVRNAFGFSPKLGGYKNAYCIPEGKLDDICKEFRNIWVYNADLILEEKSNGDYNVIKDVIGLYESAFKDET